MKKIIKIIQENKIFSLIMTMFLIIFIIIFFFLLKNELQKEIEKEYVLELFGQKEITLNLGEEYIEPGYFAYSNSLDETNNVKVSGNVNENKVGEYRIFYTIGNERIIRTIKVIANTNEEKEINFKLIGEEVITLDLNQEYEELGFIALDQNGNDLSNYVLVNNQLITNQIGTYYITYSLEYNNKVYELKREVSVIEPLAINILYDDISYKKELVLNILVTGNEFKYLKLPNQVVTNNSSVTYKITENGTYSFYAYDLNGKYIVKSIDISNIDNKIDKASCTLNVKVKSSSIVINASDNASGIKSYKYNNTEYTTNTINIDEKISSAKILVYDKAGNSKEINCQTNVIEEIYGFILIGDSRFVGMETYLGSSKRPNDTFVAKGAMGWDWFLSTAITKVNNILKENPDKKYYILCNLGVNDYKYHYDDADYAIKLSELANNEWKDHIVGYISVNPYANKNDSRNRKIETFNERQKKSLNGIYYCDTYNGIGLSNFEPRKSSDTTHYNKKTSIDIYNYIVNNCKF